MVLPGDGIGPEVVAEGERVLAAVAGRFGHSVQRSEGLIGGCAIDATGVALPNATLQACHQADAVLLGAVGGPQWDNPTGTVRPEQGLLAIRKELELFANLRPVSVHARLLDSSPLRPERLTGVDLLVVRELTGGIYFGDKSRTQLADGQERATDTLVYTTSEIERLVRISAKLARKRRHKLTSVDKANVLETSRLWRTVTTRVMQQEFPDVQLEHMLVDSCAMHLLRKPADFDVIMTENMFGDILTDEASMLAGSMGMLPSASIGAEGMNERGTRMGLYEPIHGSAPDIAGQGIANPLATILSVALMLRYSLHLEEEACAVEKAVEEALLAGFVTGDVASAGEKVYSTSEVGQAVASRI